MCVEQNKRDQLKFVFHELEWLAARVRNLAKERVEDKELKADFDHLDNEFKKLGIKIGEKHLASFDE